MKAIIFGASGQDGHYLGRVLAENGVESIPVSRSSGMIGDVSDREFVGSLISEHLPEYVFHLAANSTTRHEALFDNHAAISTGTLNILDSVYRHSQKTKVFLSGSAMQFENRGAPISELTPFAASSPYSVSRIQSVYAARYFRSLSLRVYVGYFFNHDSPLRKPNHINKKIALAARSGESIEIGDIDVRKEFNFAGDMMDAVWRLVNQDNIFEAVIGSGEAHSIEEWLDLCYGIAGRNWRDHVATKPDFVREYDILVSDPTLMRSLGWQPKVSIAELAKMMMCD